MRDHSVHDQHDHVVERRYSLPRTSLPAETIVASRRTYCEECENYNTKDNMAAKNKPHLPVFTRVDHAGNVRDSDTSFRDIRSYTTCFSDCIRASAVRTNAPMTIFRTPSGGISNTAP